MGTCCASNFCSHHLCYLTLSALEIRNSVNKTTEIVKSTTRVVSLHPLILPPVNDILSAYYTFYSFFIFLFPGASPSLDPSFCWAALRLLF